MSLDGCPKRHRTLGSRPMRQTWARPSGLAKADQPPSGDDIPEHDWLLEIADRAKPAVKAAFLEALARVREKVDLDRLREAVTRGDVNEVLRTLGVDTDMTEALQPGLTKPLEDVFINAGRATPAKTLGVTVGMRFDLTNPNTATFLRNYDFGLIKQISADTREGIRRVIMDAFKWGGHPYVQARAIRDSIGLTDSQAAAVDNFRTMLVNRDRAALTRLNRDRRHDRTLDRALGANPSRILSPDLIDKMVERNRNRALTNRAETISRNETMRAANNAMQMAWQQAADKGLLNSNTLRRYWLVTPDDRLCPYCEGVPELNPKGVSLNGLFQTALGPIAFPPLHILCRCVTFIQPGGDEGGDDDGKDE